MSGFSVTYAERIKTLPPYLFAAIDDMKQQAVARGVDIINLGIGDPDLPTPEPIITRLQEAITDPQHHQYPSSTGMLSFRTAVANWYKRRFNVTADPTSDVVTLIGSKEGIGHVPMAFIDQGDVVLVPSPGYPVYPVAARFAGGVVYEMPLVKQHGFLPDLESIPTDILHKARLMFLNSPNNPTSAIADTTFFQRVIEVANEYHIIVCHDAAYSEIFYDGQRPSSFLETKGAMEVGIEFHSLSKTFNMTGWRLGFAVGRAEIIAGLSQIKSNLDSGQCQAIQEAGITALASDDQLTEGLRAIYQERRDVLVEGLHRLGLQFETPSAAFYVWIEVPKGYTSASFTAHLLEKAGIVTTPGNGFGGPGEGYIRMTITTTKERLAEAVDRINAIGY